MPIRRLLGEAAFEPEAVTVLIAAFDECLRRLQLHDRDDPLTEILAKGIIEAALTGERDPTRFARRR